MIKLNGHRIVPTIFNDNTSQVWKIPESILKKHAYDNNYIDVTNFEIVWEFESESEIFHIVQLKTLLNVNSKKEVDVSLHMPFMPYGRQDKEISNDTTFARTCFINILKSLSFKEITSLDMHSKAPFIQDTFPEKEIDNAFEKCSPDIVCFPDKGAKNRYITFFGKFPNCSFTKDRDQETGYIKNLELNEEVDLEGKSVLIIDDICDGGMTFKLTAEKLLTLEAKEVNLYTTHGIYSKGVQTLLDSGISRVFNYKGEVFPHKQTRFLLKEF